MRDVPDPPTSIAERMRDINKRIAPFYVEAYLQGDDWGPDEWRFRLLGPNKAELILYLVPEVCDPHTVMLMVKALTAWGDIQYKLGKDHAVNKIADHLRSVI